MREIFPAIGVSVEEWLRRRPDIRPFVDEIRRCKHAGERLRPSTSLVDRSQLLTAELRRRLLDQIASLVDENWVGRAEMCVQFANLLHRALNYLQFPSRGVVGTAIYYDESGDEIFRWDHAWVRVGDEVIDGNVDSLPENPLIPPHVRVMPYWGPTTDMPKGRRLRENHGATLPADVDVEGIWWPELRPWIDQALSVSGG